jgi:hypothetical protein
MTDLKFKRASPTDLPFIMATERLDGYDRLVGRWNEVQHLSAMNDVHYAYFLARDAPKIHLDSQSFAIGHRPSA